MAVVHLDVCRWIAMIDCWSRFESKQTHGEEWVLFFCPGCSPQNYVPRKRRGGNPFVWQNVERRRKTLKTSPSWDRVSRESKTIWNNSQAFFFIVTIIVSILLSTNGWTFYYISFHVCLSWCVLWMEFVCEIGAKMLARSRFFSLSLFLSRGLHPNETLIT